MQHKELPLKNAAPVIKESFFITFPVDTALLSPRGLLWSNKVMTCISFVKLSNARPSPGVIFRVRFIILVNTTSCFLSFLSPPHFSLHHVRTKAFSCRTGPRRRLQTRQRCHRHPQTERGPKVWYVHWYHSLSITHSESDLPVVYIDEKAGSDTEGTGAELSPFASPLAAYQSFKPSPESDANPSSVATFMVRKVDSVERNDWIELSASAKKKLVKSIGGWRKAEAKLAAEGERLEKQKKEQAEKDRLRREEAKNVVLVDDPSKESKSVRLIHISISRLTLRIGQNLGRARARW